MVTSTMSHSHYRCFHFGVARRRTGGNGKDGGNGFTRRNGERTEKRAHSTRTACHAGRRERPGKTERTSRFGTLTARASVLPGLRRRFAAPRRMLCSVCLRCSVPPCLTVLSVISVTSPGSRYAEFENGCSHQPLAMIGHRE